MENLNFDGLVERYTRELERFYQRSQPMRQQMQNEPTQQQAQMPQQTPAPQPTQPQSSNQSYDDYVRENSQIGYLKVQVFTGRGTVPIEKATVTVSKDIGGQRYEIATFVTDENGATERISLPAPPRSLSEQPGNYKPYATYDVRTQYPDFVVVNNMSVPVFEGIVSLQNVNLNPLIEGNGKTEEYFNEAERENLL